ncbi:MAG: extracellular solute-binding protein [Geminicoccaceae bacterium]|nr:extracellular solute-binding protein [Geminicoccaceae bacterium]
MSFRDHDRKTFIADTARAYGRRRITRRQFFRKMALAGVGFSGFSATMMGGGRPWGGLTNLGTPLAQAQTPDDVTAWLKDVGRQFAGTTIRYTSEATPPTNVASELKSEFEEATGINVEIEIVPLEQVLQKATLDAQGQLGTYDLYYLDQAWAALFSPDTFNPREYYDSKPELAMPGYDWDDFSPPLVQGIAMANDQMMGVPFDIPIFILMYRKDLYDKHGLSVPTTMQEYMDVTRALHEAEIGNGIYGTTGQLKSGHYSLECDWTAWLWSHGGSIFGPDGMFTGNDEAGMRGLQYMLDLVNYMPPDAKTWTWDGQWQSMAQGVAAQCISWGEFFPGLDGGDSKVGGGKMAAAIPPEEAALRTPDETGFNEIPHIGHQGGSSIALSRYSKNPDAAWLFMQWVTSKDVVARSCIVGGGASPVRLSAFKDPRVLAAAEPGAGTTRHFPAIEWTINNRMGSEPDLPSWPEIANNVIPVELGKLLAGQYSSPEEAMNAIAEQTNELAAPFRG